METQITVNEIEEYFATTGRPDFVVQLDACSHVKPENARLFIQGSAAAVQNQPDNKYYLSYWENLVKYYEKVKKARIILSRQKGTNDTSKG